jgi:hypothetical protein
MRLFKRQVSWVALVFFIVYVNIVVSNFQLWLPLLLFIISSEKPHFSTFQYQVQNIICLELETQISIVDTPKYSYYSLPELFN